MTHLYNVSTLESVLPDSPVPRNDASAISFCCSSASFLAALAALAALVSAVLRALACAAVSP